MQLTTDNQTHRIKRLVVELNVTQQSEADLLHEKVSRLCQSQLIQLLEQGLAGIAVAEQHRLDRLELDLGNIDLADFDVEFVSRLVSSLRSELPRQLAHAVGTAGGSAEGRNQSRLGLFAIYARQGHLPWWVDSKTFTSLDDLANKIQDVDPDGMDVLLRELLKDRHALGRIVRHCRDETLARLAGRLCRSQSKVIGRLTPELAGVLDRCIKRDSAKPVAQRIFPSPVNHPQQLAWEAILHTAASASTHRSASQLFWRDSLVRLAVISGTRYNDLLSGINGFLEATAGGNFSTQFRDLMVGLYRDTVQFSDDIEQADPDEQAGAGWPTLLQQLTKMTVGNSQTIARLFARSMRDTPKPDRAILTGLHDHAAVLRSLLTKTQQTDLDNLLATLTPDNSGRDNYRRLTWQCLLDLLAKTSHTDDVTPRSSRDELVNYLDVLLNTGMSPDRNSITQLNKRKAQWQAIFRPDQQQVLADILARGKSEELAPTQIEKNRQRRIHPSVFEQDDEVYVENAGLAILAPFLERFFERMELLHEKRFRDEQAMQRAIGLLQYLVDEDADGPEYLLPLNKILCGMKPDDVFDFGVAIQEQEKQECLQLLEAVIAHASILRTMSINGFRGSFLFRKGILLVRDGAWLLRVERESFDIVLERFPWSFGWIKLPWMQMPLRVEWL